MGSHQTLSGSRHAHALRVAEAAVCTLPVHQGPAGSVAASHQRVTGHHRRLSPELRGRILQAP